MAGRGAYQKKARNIENVRARHDLLIEGIVKPASVERNVHVSVMGQRAFAALNLPKLKITPIALNTLKSLSDELFTDPDENGNTGFTYINALRIRLMQSLANAANSRTVEAKANRAADNITHLKAQLAAVEAHSTKRQKAYLSLYAAVNGLIKKGNLQAEAQERLYRVLENHHAAFSALFEPDGGKASGGDANVTNLHEMDKTK